MNRTGQLAGNRVYVLTVGKNVAHKRCPVHHKGTSWISSEAFIETWTDIFFFRMPEFIGKPRSVRQLKAHAARKCLRFLMQRPFSLEACKGGVRAATVAYSLAGSPLLLFPSSLIGFLSVGLTGSTV